MGNKELLIILAVGMLGMVIVISYQMKIYQVERWKALPVALIFVLAGVYGSEVWYFIESGRIGGRSLYGAVVFSPLICVFVSKMIKIPYGYLLDFLAPSGCMVLSLVKIQCLRDGCCAGKVLYLDENHVYVRFPSQILEMSVFFLIFIALLLMSPKIKYRKKIFPYFLIFYGLARFFMDFLRDTAQLYPFGLSAGSFWSLCSCIIGVIVLLIMNIKRRKMQGI